MTKIVPVENAAQVAQVRELFEEYWQSFGFSPCFQGFAGELAGLPGNYAPPEGRLAIAVVEGGAAGCVALRRLDDGSCEAKRLFVRPHFRGHGVARQLMEWVIAEARAAGYREVVGHTLAIMTTAVALYDRMGFERSLPNAGQNAEGAIYIRLPL